MSCFWLSRKSERLIIVLIILTFGFFSKTASSSDQLTIFAAASTTEAIEEIIELYKTSNPDIEIIVSFAATSTLAKQILNGANVDIFISANQQWMDYLDNKNLISITFRVNLLKNRLALIAPNNSTNSLSIENDLQIIDIIRHNYLAIGDPEHVPAGIYAKSALEYFKVWNIIEKRTLRTANVWAALVLVERAEAALGIVYLSDALLSNKIRILDLFPEKSHPAIIYPSAILSGRERAASKLFLSFLQSEDAYEIFTKNGFIREGP